MTFFTDVLLPANGYTVSIRKVDAAGISQAATLRALTDGPQADYSDDMLDSLQHLGQSEQLTPQILRTLLTAADEINRALITESVVDLPALLSAYRATGTERDFGLGPDYVTLIAAIRVHNGIPDVPAQTALQSLSVLPAAVPTLPAKSKKKK